MAYRDQTISAADAGGCQAQEQSLGWAQLEPDTLDYDGFYTQDDIREIVAYAKDRFIEIVPEIDIPGHTQAAVASYPEILACDPESPTKCGAIRVYQPTS